MKSILKTFILLINSVNSILTLDTIQKVNSDIIDNNSMNISFFRCALDYFISYLYVPKKDLQYTILNPLLGYLSLKNGLISNFRLYNPLNTESYDENGEKNHDEYKSFIKLTKAFITLFPSSSGILSINENDPKSFTTKYFSGSSENEKINNIKHLADILIKIINNEKYDENKLKKGIEKDLGELLLLFNGEKIIKDHKELKILLMNAYAVSVLNTEEQYKAYTNILFNIKTNKINPEPLNKKEKNEFSSLYLNLDVSNLPYTYSNQPEKETSLQVYDRKKDLYISGKSFSDHVEISILHLCNCLFYDKKNKKYNLEHLELDKDSALKKFYENFGRKMFPITEEIRNEWSKVVQGLEDHSFKSFNKYKPYLIQYCRKDYRNELKPGIINIMSVLSKICGSSNKKIINVYENLVSKDPLDTSKIADLFIDLLNNLYGPNNMKISLLNKENYIKIEEIDTFERVDFIGKIEIGFNFKVESSIQSQELMRLKISDDYCEITYEETFNTLTNTEFESLRNNTSSSTVLSLIKSYLSTFNGKIESNIKNYDTSNCLYLYNQGILNTNQQKSKYLFELEKLQSKEDANKELLPDFKNICENIIKSVSLRDSEIRDLFLRFFCFSEDLRATLKDKEIHDIWYSLSLENKNSNIKVLKDSWEMAIENDCTVTELEFDGSKHPYDYTEKLLKLCDSSLIKLSFESYDDFENNFREISEILFDMPFLESLHLSNNGYYLIKSTEEILENNTSIRSLCLSKNTISKDDMKSISEGLKKNNTLKSLNFTYCSFNTGCFSILSNALNENESVESLNISNSKYDQSELIELLVTLKENKKIKHLNLSSNGLGREGVSTIITYLNNNESLQYLNIASNDIG